MATLTAPFAASRRAPAFLQAGATLLEVLVSLVLVLVALLGAVGLMARSNQSELEAYQRFQAIALNQDMVSRLNANRDAAACYSNGIDGMTLGTGAAPATACVGAAKATYAATAVADLNAWHQALLGSTEQQGTTKLGAMVGARGCIEQIDAVAQEYRISVVWQGLTATAAPAVACGQGQFGNDAYRRAVVTVVRIGKLS
ncbi:type IV pilus modification protein PilV [Imbroritus primus]|uniref:type IV pilus modification protein PilV n=1 Tax=Imbroritus primus TaxID=3058603 RepID=UPI003D1611F6